MQGSAIPDIRPFIANDQWAVRWCFCMALMAFGIGLLILGLFIFAYLKSGQFGGIERIGGAVGVMVSLVSLVPFNQLLTRRDRLRILLALQARLDERETEFPEEDTKRVRDLIWDMYKKGLTS